MLVFLLTGMEMGLQYVKAVGNVQTKMETGDWGEGPFQSGWRK